MEKSKLVVWSVCLLLFTSCGSNYRMTSRVRSDGSMIREVYASGDSAFLAGDNKRQPFLFRIDSGWELTRLDPPESVNFWGEKYLMNVKVSRKLSEVGAECFQTLEGKEFMHPLVVPKEALKKKFRWFFTYYTFNATYQELPDKGPVPLELYMTATELELWFQGERTAFEGWNGIEMKNTLDDLDSKFWKWFARSQYEISWAILYRIESLQQPDSIYLHHLMAYKEDVFKAMSAKDNVEDLDKGTPEAVCNFFDAFCKTSQYTDLYKANKDSIDAMFQEKCRMTDLAGYVIRYELSMPGQLLASNAPSQVEGRLIWRVDVMRLLNADYILTAESRVPNYWAFGITFLFFLFAAFGCWKARRRE